MAARAMAPAIRATGADLLTAAPVYCAGAEVVAEPPTAPTGEELGEDGVTEVRMEAEATGGGTAAPVV